MRRPTSPAGWLVLVVPLIILAFVATHVLTVTLARESRSHATSIEATGKRSHALTALRGDLVRMDMAQELVEHGDEFDRESYEATRRAANLELDRLRELPAPADEQAALDEVVPAVLDAERAIERSVALLESGHRREAADVAALPLVRLADSQIERLAHLQMRGNARDSKAIEATDRRLRYLSPVFDGVAAAFALVLLLLARGAARQQTRLVDERNNLTEQRAAELEAFAGRVAHDLRNPLGTIALRAQADIKRFAGEPVVLGEFVKISRATERMEHLIEGLLAFARAGGRPDSTASTIVADVLEGVVGDFVDDAATTHIELLVHSAPRIAVACPAGALSSILGNLMRNAIKFVVEGPVPERRVIVRTTRIDDKIRIEIEDTGPGIPAGMESVIFEPFVRGRASTRQPGLGLGLATVKRLVEAYRGKITVQAGSGGLGSCFAVELPAAVG